MSPPTHLHSRWRRWTSLLIRFLSGELVVQGLGFVTGIFLFRTLTKDDMALYTLANSMLGMMALMSDNGVGAGIYAIGGRVWGDRHRFGQLIATAFHIRRRLAWVTMATIGPLTWYLLHRTCGNPWLASWITLIVLVGTHFQILVSILGEIPKLHLQALRVQKLNVGVALVRLALLAVFWLGKLNILTALIANTIGSAVQSRVLRRWMPALADPQAPVHEEDRRALISLIKRQLPSSIFYCLQGQITLLLITFIGNASAIADVGALGALGRLFAVIASVMATIIYPRFAHIQEAGLLWRRYLQIVTLFILLGVGLTGFTALFPTELLWLLGHKYGHLEHEVLLMVAGSVLGVITGTLWSLNSTRGWILSPWIQIPVGLATQVLLIWWLRVSDLRDVLWLGLLSNIPGLLINFCQTWLQIRRMKSSPAPEV